MRISGPFPAAALAFVLAAAGSLSCPAAGAAQEAARVRIGGGLSAALLVGDASDFLDSGLGAFATGEVRLDEGGHVHLRIDGAWTPLHDDVDQLTGARAGNDVLALVVGPQLSGHPGRLRLYGMGLIGLVGVAWNTEGGTIDGDDGDLESGFAWGAGTGLGLVLGTGAHPVVLRAEARVIDAGEYAFARAPPPGNPPSTVGLIREDFGAVSLSIGFAVGL